MATATEPLGELVDERSKVCFCKSAGTQLTQQHAHVGKRAAGEAPHFVRAALCSPAIGAPQPAVSGATTSS